MAMGTQTEQVIDYVKAFLQQAADAGAEWPFVLEQWTSADNIGDVEALLKKSAPKKGSDKLKDPNKPKRGKSGYLYFCADKRAAVKAELPEGAKPTEVTTELGRQWNALKLSSKAGDKKRLTQYMKLAAADKKRYDEAIVLYDPPSTSELELLAVNKPKRGRKSSTKKPTAADGKPKRGRSAYLFYCMKQRAAVKTDMPDAEATAVTTELGRRWKELKEDEEREDELAVYQEQAAVDKKRYQTEMAAWETTGDAPVPQVKKSPVDDEATQPNDDDDIENIVDSIVDDVPPKKRKMPAFTQAEHPGFKSFSVMMEISARKALGGKPTKAALRKKLLALWAPLSDQDKAEYADE